VSEELPVWVRSFQTRSSVPVGTGRSSSSWLRTGRAVSGGWVDGQGGPDGTSLSLALSGSGCRDRFSGLLRVAGWLTSTLSCPRSETEESSPERHKEMNTFELNHTTFTLLCWIWPPMMGSYYWYFCSLSEGLLTPPTKRKATAAHHLVLQSSILLMWSSILVVVKEILEVASCVTAIDT